MKAQGREHAEWGFKKPADGWHIVEMGEGIDLLKNKEGEIVKDKKDAKLWKFPAKINDANADDNGADIGQVISETSFGEQKIADILAGAGEFANFEKAYPGDHSFFESAIMDKIKIKVPEKFCKMKTETSKDGYVNVVEIATMQFKPEEKAGKGKKETKAPAAAAAGSEKSDW
jgi:hypothetical protein